MRRGGSSRPLRTRRFAAAADWPRAVTAGTDHVLQRADHGVRRSPSGWTLNSTRIFMLCTSMPRRVTSRSEVVDQFVIERIHVFTLPKR